MDFFAAQEHARRMTYWLVFWFIVAVVGIIGTLYVAAVFLMTDQQTPFVWWQPELFAIVSLTAGTVILIASLYKISQLSKGGGAAVATELGGRLVQRNTQDPLEQLLINVVDEMAIASGTQVPSVYVLDKESGINAFAAGHSPGNAVVAVTRGALENLPRDELQGVIAHEFSHILNGDMRLNIRLMGVLNGILFLYLAGQTMVRVLGRSASRSRDKNNGLAALVLAGLCLIVVGYIGLVCGKIIKAAVSRQREFLADASAVQFTRNPAGLAGALKRIAGIGSAIKHPKAEEASHMFFGSSFSLSHLLATHPPVVERIKRIDRSALQGISTTGTSHAGRPVAETAAGFVAGIGTTTETHLERSDALLAALPNKLKETVHRPSGALAMALATLLSPDETIRERQAALIQQRFSQSIRDQTVRIADWLQQADPALRLPLFDLALPALTCRSPATRENTLATVDAITTQTDKPKLSQYIYAALLHSNLKTGSRRVRTGFINVVPQISALLAVLAHVGSQDEAAARAAFEQAAPLAPTSVAWPQGKLSISAKTLDDILETLAATKPLFRKRIVEACVQTVYADNKVTVAEAELLRAICQALECPVPPLAQYAG